MGGYFNVDSYSLEYYRALTSVTEEIIHYTIHLRYLWSIPIINNGIYNFEIVYWFWSAFLYYVIILKAT